MLKAPLEHKDGSVRDGAIALCCEIYRWMGAVFQQQLGSLKLKPAQLKDLETKFKDIKFGEARPNKRTRAEEKKGLPKGGAAGKAGGKAEVKEEAFDPLSLVKGQSTHTTATTDVRLLSFLCGAHTQRV
jgi:hypothetical protein